jgi:hypothetical protein
LSASSKRCAVASVIMRQGRVNCMPA